MDNYLGFVTLGDTLVGSVPIRDLNYAPKDPTTLPSFRVYGPGGLMTNGTGSLAKLNTGSVTDATNASPIVITSAAHGLTTGTRVTVADVGGNTAANGDFNVTVLSSSTFSLDGSTGNGAYTSGGTWHVTGLYSITIAATAGNGYESGKTYQAFVSWSTGGNSYTSVQGLTVT